MKGPVMTKLSVNLTAPCWAICASDISPARLKRMSTPAKVASDPAFWPATFGHAEHEALCVALLTSRPPTSKISIAMPVPGGLYGVTGCLAGCPRGALRIPVRRSGED